MSRPTPGSARISAPRPSRGTRACSAATAAGEASVRSRIACQRIAGSESSSQSMGSTKICYRARRRPAGCDCVARTFLSAQGASSATEFRDLRPQSNREFYVRPEFREVVSLVRGQEMSAPHNPNSIKIQALSTTMDNLQPYSTESLPNRILLNVFDFFAKALVIS